MKLKFHTQFPCFSWIFKRTMLFQIHIVFRAPFFDLKNSECYSYIRLNGCFYFDLCEMCDIRQTPCWTRGIKIIITLEIGHGGGCTLVIFRGRMPVPAGTKPGERERKENDRIPNLTLWERVRVPNFIQSRLRFVMVSHFERRRMRRVTE